MPTYHVKDVKAGKPKMLCDMILLSHYIGCIIAVYLKEILALLKIYKEYKLLRNRSFCIRTQIFDKRKIYHSHYAISGYR
jgi:hypothetical protein